jgi:hypothetical protein
MDEGMRASLSVTLHLFTKCGCLEKVTEKDLPGLMPAQLRTTGTFTVFLRKTYKAHRYLFFCTITFLPNFTPILASCFRDSHQHAAC